MQRLRPGIFDDCQRKFGGPWSRPLLHLKLSQGLESRSPLSLADCGRFDAVTIVSFTESMIHLVESKSLESDIGETCI